MSVDHDIANINADNHSLCAQCHVAPSAPYVWGTHHEDGTMEYNSNTDLSYDTAAGTCNSSCHDNTGAYAALNASTIFTPHLGLNGAGAACTTCHGADSGGQAGRLWPDNVANNPSRSAYADDDIGAHDNHITAIGQYLGYGDWTVSMYSQSNQITICAFCHPSPGRHRPRHERRHGDFGGTDRASVFNTNGRRRVQSFHRDVAQRHGSGFGDGFQLHELELFEPGLPQPDHDSRGGLGDSPGGELHDLVSPDWAATRTVTTPT